MIMTPDPPKNRHISFRRIFKARRHRAYRPSHSLSWGGFGSATCIAGDIPSKSPGWGGTLPPPYNKCRCDCLRAITTAILLSPELQERGQVVEQRFTCRPCRSLSGCNDPWRGGEPAPCGRPWFSYEHGNHACEPSSDSRVGMYVSFLSVFLIYINKLTCSRTALDTQQMPGGAKKAVQNYSIFSKYTSNCRKKTIFF